MQLKYLILVVALMSLPSPVQARTDIIVAVASSVFSPSKQIASVFEKKYHVSVKLVPGSTGTLYSQIMHGAPYDVFMSADDKTPDKIRKGQGRPSESIETYATGRLFICVQAGIPNLRHLSGRIAIADPKIAPYGRAAREVLVHVSKWPTSNGSLVYAPNVMMASAYLERGLVTTAFVASSAVSTSIENRCRPVDRSLYEPIRQQALLLESNPLAQDWFEFIRGPAAKVIWKRAGFLEGNQ